MKDSKKIIYIVVSILTLIIVITGSTYAYFALTASNNNAITGSTANVGLTLAVNKITPSGNTTDYLVPQLENYLETAINSPYNCIDDNNNTVCQVYKATLTNTGSATEKVKGTITFSGINNIPHLKWKMITNSTTIGSNTGVTASTAATQFVGETTLNASQSIDYYFVVWIDEIGSEQTDRGTYAGTITFTSSNGRGITSTIGEVTTFTGTIYRKSTENLSIGNTIAQETKQVWCANSTEYGNSCDFGVSWNSQSECENYVTNNSMENTTCQQGTVTTGISSYVTDPSELNSIYYLKHTIVDDIVTESYVEFVVTPEMAQANQGMIAGTYTLRGAGATSNGSGGYNNDSPYYETNKQTLLTAFGSSNCEVNLSGVFCFLSVLRTNLTPHGDVSVGDASANCSVNIEGGSSCGS